MRPDEDPQHYQYMVSVGAQAIIKGLREDGGPIRIRKSRPFEALGLTMPKGHTVDAVMDELEAAAKKKP